MSEENVEVVRDALDAFGRGGLDAMADYWTEDVEHRAVEGAIDDRGPMHGKAAVRAYAQDWLDNFDNFRSEAVELFDAGEDTVIAVVRISGLAKLSAIETDLTYAALYTIRDEDRAGPRVRDQAGGPRSRRAAGVVVWTISSGGASESRTATGSPVARPSPGGLRESGRRGSRAARACRHCDGPLPDPAGRR
jgi:ketosteroid isomerase-like protein